MAVLIHHRPILHRHHAGIDYASIVYPSLYHSYTPRISSFICHCSVHHARIIYARVCVGHPKPQARSPHTPHNSTDMYPHVYAVRSEGEVYWFLIAPTVGLW